MNVLTSSGAARLQRKTTSSQTGEPCTGKRSQTLEESAFRLGDTKQEGIEEAGCWVLGWWWG